MIIWTPNHSIVQIYITNNQTPTPLFNLPFLLISLPPNPNSLTPKPRLNSPQNTKHRKQKHFYIPPNTKRLQTDGWSAKRIHMLRPGLFRIRSRPGRPISGTLHIKQCCTRREGGGRRRRESGWPQWTAEKGGSGEWSWGSDLDS